MSLQRTAVNNSVTTALVFIAIAIFGVFSLMNLSINQLPDMETNFIMVMTSYQGASAQDIETNISKTLENTLNAVPDLKHISSTSKENTSVISLEFESGIDIETATNNVRDKLDIVRNYLPDGCTNPVLFKFNAEDMPIMLLSVTAEESLPALEKIIDDRITTPLARVSGVGTVSASGAPKREIQVYVDPNKLESYNLALETISTTLMNENRNIPAGYLDIGSNSYNIRIQKEFGSAKEMEDVIVGSFNGAPIYLRDIARVVDGPEERSQESYSNGVQGATITIQKQTDANAVNVIKGIKKKLNEIEKNLPSDVKVTIIVDGSTSIISTISSLRDTIFITFLLVMLVVFVFLGHWRATFIIVLAIPISLLASLIYLYATGNTLNIISMSALSLAIGMVVDDAIVVLENITTHIEKGEKPKEAAVHATQEVQLSVIASTLTMLAVFLPLTMIKGTTGVMFKQLGWIVSIIMIVSTTGALTLVPMMCAKMLVMNPYQGKLHKVIFTPINKGLDAISNGYARLINWAVNHRKIVFFSMIGLFLISVIVFGPLIKTEMMPKSDSDRISINIELPVGTGQDVTGAFAKELADEFMAMPEVKICNFSFGQADSDNAFASMRSNGTHIISYNLRIGTKTERRKAGLRTSTEIAEDIRTRLNAIPQIKKANVNEGGGGMGASSSVVIEVYGYDFGTTDRIANELAQKLRDRGIKQVIVSRDAYTPEYQVDFDREKLALNGLNSTTAATYVSNRIKGSVTSYYREDGDEYDIRVRYAPEFRQSIENIEDIKIYNGYGQAVRVGDLGKVVETLTPPQIERKDRERLVKVTAMLGKGQVLSDAVKMANEVIEETEIPQEIVTTIAGDYETQKEMFGDLFVLLVLIIILVYIVMAAQFENLMKPFVIMFSVPFTFTGVLIGLWANNMALGVMAFVGILILMGIVVKNGIVLIDYTTLLEERGTDVKEATVQAARSRLRPILMTTLTTVLGMIPLALGRGEGAEMWNSLGVTVAWGLTVSTLITLLFIPAFYCSLETRAVRRKKRKAEKALTATENIR
ncbi:MAG: efflux RND transporter permease subunit [Bacteroidales bacterium]|nr:efflux RND transporter permease subunit [Bacteroidales bacterium]